MATYLSEPLRLTHPQIVSPHPVRHHISIARPLSDVASSTRQHEVREVVGSLVKERLDVIDMGDDSEPREADTTPGTPTFLDLQLS
jgi:hypothetical protein